MNQRIGDLNGWWAWTLKVALVAFPVALTTGVSFGVYVVQKGYAHEVRIAALEQLRFTLKDANELEQRLQTQRETATARLEAKIDRLSDKIEALTARAPR